MKTKNSIILSGSAVALAALFLLPGLALADVQGSLYIQGPGGSVLVNSALTVPATCTVQDSAGASHDFTGHKAICALQAAKDTGIITDFVVTDWGFGFSLDSVNGTANALDWSELWQLWVNGKTADVGIQGIVLSQGDDFQLTYGPWPTGIISLAQNTPGGPVVTDIYPRRLRVEEAVSFLVANQQENGSFGHSLFTDWVAIALGAYQGNSASAFYAKEKLVEWLKENQIPAGSPLTDFERRAMALMSLDISPYNGTETNYIQAILNGFDGQQFGSVNLVNDDIFALLVLLRAGYQAQEGAVANALQFILGSQREDGSFGDTDMTAAAIQLLDLVSSGKERDEAVRKAKAYLEKKQESTGGFGNVYSTSWVLQAIAALQENGDSWVIDDRTPEHFLALRQASDGGLLQAESKENRVWASAYAIPAALGKPWGSILGTFEKPLALLPKEASQEGSLVPSVVQDEKAVVVESIKQQIIALQREVAVLSQLEYIQSELDRIALEVKAVQVGVVAFHIEQLAQNIGQPRPETLAQAPAPAPAPTPAPPVARVNEPLAPSQDLSLDPDLSAITLVQEDETTPLAAEAKAAAGSQGLSPQLIFLVVIVGGALLMFSGRMSNVLSLLRKTFFKVYHRG
ncbi:MAG: DUF4430 domain-containing protein [Candidatus Wildermuthbacteria bacterium]|nr:DUF4430 domain-containing protein [Candidatus Wildermuthbacteria bacterium]